MEMTGYWMKAVAPVNSLTGSSDNAETQGNKHDFSEAMAVSARPHGVTVNKMQEWMHKGRMLSSEMKQRITGSSLRAHGPSSLRSGHGVSNRTKAATQMTRVQGSKSVAPCRGAQQSGRHVARRDNWIHFSGTLECCHSPLKKKKKKKNSTGGSSKCKAKGWNATLCFPHDSF